MGACLSAPKPSERPATAPQIEQEQRFDDAVNKLEGQLDRVQQHNKRLMQHIDTARQMGWTPPSSAPLTPKPRPPL